MNELDVPATSSPCMLRPVEEAGAAPKQINVVQNWFEELKRRVPTGTKGLHLDRRGKRIFYQWANCIVGMSLAAAAFDPSKIVP